MTAAHPDRYSTTLEGLDIQRHVIGALMMRELHTRYGRDNIGYLWMLLEPGLLATAVAAIHIGQKPHTGDLMPIGFALCGYCAFIIFRSIVGRAESALEGNLPLLFHRVVTIFDILLARCLLEALSTITTLIILLACACALNLAEAPVDLLTFLTALVLLIWFSFALSMPVCAGAYLNKSVAKLVHPLLYISMPMSGAFFLLKWIPDPYRSWLAWSPMTQIFEMLHYAQYGERDNFFFNIEYIVGWCLGVTLIGLLSLTLIRRHVHLN